MGVLHVQTVVMERSREDVSFAMSGVDGRGVVHSNIPIGEGMVPLAVDVSDGEALVWFDRERRLRRLGDAVLSPGDGVRALGKLMEGQAVDLSLCDREPVDTVLGYLQEAEGELVAEADLDSQTKQFLAESYEPVEPIVFVRNDRKADRVAYLHVLASEAMSARVHALHLLNEMRAAGASAKDFAFALHTVDKSDSLARRLEECRKDIEADNEQFGK